MKKKEMSGYGVIIMIILSLATIYFTIISASEIFGFIANESGYFLKLVTPVIGSSKSNETYKISFVVGTSLSALTGNESGYRIEGNIYTSGIGGSYNESGYTFYLTPEQAFYSYKEDITAYDEVSTTTTITTSTSTTTSSTTTTTLPLVIYNTTVNFTAGQSQVINATGTNVSLTIVASGNLTNVAINISSYSGNPTNASFSVSGLGRYIAIDGSAALLGNLSYVILSIGYTDEEITNLNLNESTLGFYWYNSTVSEWQRLNSITSWMTPWVYETGVNTTTNFVWANASHFSIYTLGGISQSSLFNVLLFQGWNLISLPLSI